MLAVRLAPTIFVVGIHADASGWIPVENSVISASWQAEWEQLPSGLQCNVLGVVVLAYCRHNITSKVLGLHCRAESIFILSRVCRQEGAGSGETRARNTNDKAR